MTGDVDDTNHATSGSSKSLWTVEHSLHLINGGVLFDAVMGCNVIHF